MSTLNLTRPIHPADYEHICKQIKITSSPKAWIQLPVGNKAFAIAPTEANVAKVHLSRLICPSARHGCTGSSEYILLQHL